RFAGRLTQVAEGLVAGLEVLKSPTRFVGVVAWSLLQWLVNAAAFALCFRAFGLPVPPEGAFLLQGIIGFGVALPASPGFVGVFEAATRVTLAIYGIDATRAVSYAVAYHVSTFVPITLLGLYSLSRLQLELADELVVTRTTSGITLTVHGPDLGPPEANLAVRAARAALEATGSTFGVAIELTKRIPVRAGLGGGSSDAGAVLHAVNALVH